jgi:hypothetical protein
MQRFVSIMGIFNESSSAFFGILLIAAVGHLREQRSQLSLLVFTMQKCGSQTATPICVADFSALVMRLIAPVGQTSEHFTHSGRQYPRSKDMCGFVLSERST